MKMHWKILIGLVTVTLPPFLTYLASRAEASEASIRAQVAYEAWQEAVKELQEESFKHALDIAEIKGELKAERRECVAASKTTLPKLSDRPAFDGDGLPDSPPKLRSKPPSFDDAVKSYKSKK